MKFVSQSYYDILDVDPDSRDEDIKRAYRVVRQSFDPGSSALHSLYSHEESEAIAAKIDEAYQVLNNRDRRRTYDRYLENVHHVDPELVQQSTPLDEVDGAPAEDVPLPEAIEISGSLHDLDELLTVDRPMPDDADSVSVSVSVASMEPFDDSVDESMDEGEGEDSYSRPFIRSWTRGYAEKRRGDALALQLLPLSEEAQRDLISGIAVSGAMLRQLRKMRGVALGTIAQETKISVMTLRFIEQDVFQNLPAAIYLRGFVGQYVRLLQLPSQTVDQYMITIPHDS